MNTIDGAIRGYRETIGWICRPTGRDGLLISVNEYVNGPITFVDYVGFVISELLMTTASCFAWWQISGLLVLSTGTSDGFMIGIIIMLVSIALAISLPVIVPLFGIIIELILCCYDMFNNKSPKNVNRNVEIV